MNNDKKETAANAAKRAGLRSLAEAESICNKSRRTLENWFKNNRQSFDVMILGCVLVKNRKRLNNEKVLK